MEDSTAGRLKSCLLGRKIRPKKMRTEMTHVDSKCCTYRLCPLVGVCAAEASEGWPWYKDTAKLGATNKETKGLSLLYT